MKFIVFLYLILVTNAFQQVYFTLTTLGNQFQPANSVELLTISFNTRTILSCAILCYRNNQCRTFDFDSNSQECRLFEGSLDTGILLSVSPSTIVGWINIDQSLYYFYNASNDKCLNNRFLDTNSLSGLCQCPIHQFWNGSMCLNQRYHGQLCQNDNWCRTDLTINCVAFLCVGKIDLFKDFSQRQQSFHHFPFHKFSLHQIFKT
jgi:hypothetical protein